MTDYSQDQSITNEELRARIETLEGYVTEIGNVLHDIIERLHGIPYPPECPPMCPRENEIESS